MVKHIRKSKGLSPAGDNPFGLAPIPGNVELEAVDIDLLVELPDKAGLLAGPADVGGVLVQARPARIPANLVQGVLAVGGVVDVVLATKTAPPRMAASGVNQPWL